MPKKYKNVKSRPGKRKGTHERQSRMTQRNTRSYIHRKRRQETRTRDKTDKHMNLTNYIIKTQMERTVHIWGKPLERRGNRK